MTHGRSRLLPAGFYRVNYDVLTWIFLAEAMNGDQISSPAQRGALVDDALTLMRARRAEPWLAMYMLQYGVPRDTSLPVWGAASKGINYLRAVLSDDLQATEDFNVSAAGRRGACDSL